jgi:hypothetical protein
MSLAAIEFFWPDDPVNLTKSGVNPSTVSTQIVGPAAGDISGRALAIREWLPKDITSRRQDAVGNCEEVLRFANR